MSQAFNVSVDKKKTQVFVGSGENTKDNKVTIKIVSKTDTTTIKMLAVKVDVGNDENALVSVATDLRLVAVVSPAVAEDPSEQLEISGSEPDESSYNWSIKYGRRGFDVDATDGLVLTFTGIVSETNAGLAKVKLAFDLTGNAKDSEEVAIQKQQDEKQFEIVKFTATPTYLSGSGKVTFSWSVNQATSVELLRDGHMVPIPTKDNLTQNAFPDYPPKDGENRYLLIAKRAGHKEDITREIIVRRERPGWISLDYSGSYGEPSTLFGGLIFGEDTTPSMAGIFIKDGQARLYRSQSGTGAWLQESSSVPRGMETSPGVVFDKKLWLLGGSAVSPDQGSDRIWHYTRDEGWKEWNSRAERFSPRMGHACVVFDNKLWVMGGFDENGNAQNDVWQLAKGDENWQGPTTANWPGRCMFGAASSDDHIVVYAGVKEPFGAGYKDLWSRTKTDEAWKKEKEPDVGAEYALASAVGRLVGQWYFVATYLIGNLEELKFNAWAKNQGSFTAMPRKPQLETYQVTPYSLAAIEFGGRMFLRALGDRTGITKCRLHVYIPEVR
ncbi:Kelch repeat-containing protein [Nitrospira sp. Ecomares 2.1]